MPRLKRVWGQIRTYMTRSRTKAQKSLVDAAPEVSVDSTTGIKLVNLACDLDNMLQSAISDEHARDVDNIGDEEEGDEFNYPSQKPQRVDAPVSQGTRSHTPATPVKISRRKKHLATIARAPPRGPATTRRVRRQAGKSNWVPKYKVRSSISLRFRGDKVIKTRFDIEHARVSKGAYIGRRQPQLEDPKLENLAELKRRGYRVIEGDRDETVVILDSKRRIVAVLAGRPASEEEADWNAIVQEFIRAMDEANASLKMKGGRNRRGQYRTAAYGVSYGGGQMRPGMLRQNKHNTRVLKKLLSNPAVQRVAHFASSMFALFAPKLYSDYHEQLGLLYAQYDELCRIFPNSVFPATSFNFGPRALSTTHIDHANRPVGWCSIFAAGDFDHKLGGHLVLHELRLIIEFPSGSTILIPSATCTHGNTPIQDGESRVVLTQYAAGGLFRYVEYGFKTWKTLLADSPNLAKELDVKRKTRWAEQLKFYSKFGQLHDDRIASGIAS